MKNDLCIKCKGKGLCKEPCPIINNFLKPKIKQHFSGSSPEIFVGRYGYPLINAGVLASPYDYDSEVYSMPELWHERKFSIEQIINLRSRLVYGKFKVSIKKIKNKFLDTTKEIAMSSKPVSTEVFLKKIPSSNIIKDPHIPLITNPAPLQKIVLEENPKVKRKVEYLINDKDVKATTAIIELYKTKIEITNINKIFSAGLLGLPYQRKLVPTRWSITAVDDIISKSLLKEIKHYPEINEFRVFYSEYLGNHYEFLLLPEKFKFEVIEAKMPGSVWNKTQKLFFAIDYENFNGRKTYAENVGGAYYANRLAVAEYLEKIKKQASCLVIRECTPQYYAPCGVGILREASREAFSKKPEIFESLEDALKSINSRLKLNIEMFVKNSWLLREYKEQRKLKDFLNHER